jgi:hypothetical protein
VVGIIESVLTRSSTFCRKAQPSTPWAGIGIGYEFYAVSGWEKGHGPEFVNLQLGVSFPVARHVTAGPFLAVAIGRYTQVTRERAGQVYDDKPVHDWLILGLAAAYGP